MITNLQVLRVLAALGVLFYHTRIETFGKHIDFQGVEIFFVISGFIMTFITRRSADNFLTHRLVRIVPLYWAISLLSLVWVGFALTNPLSSIPTIIALAKSGTGPLSAWIWTYAQNLLTAETGERLLKSLFFFPFGRNPGPVLGVGWTLNLEMFYYFVFWAALLLSQKLAPAITIAALAAMQKYDCGAACTLYGSNYTLYFIFGIPLYYLWKAIGAIDNRYLSRAILAGSIVIFAAFFYANMTGLVYTSRVAFLAGPVMVVAAALFLHSCGMSVRHPLPILLGDASYALYLIHPLTVETFTNATRDVSWLYPPNNVLGFVVSAALSLLIAVAIHLWVEKPTLRVLRGLTDRSRSAPRHCYAMKRD